MIGVVTEDDFDIKIDSDEQGLIVIVTFTPNKRRRYARPKPGEKVRAVINTLRAEWMQEIFPEDELIIAFVCGPGRSHERLEHRTTGKFRWILNGSLEGRIDAYASLIEELRSEDIWLKLEDAA